VECEVIPHRHLVSRRPADSAENGQLSQQLAALVSPDLAPPNGDLGKHHLLCAVTTPLRAPADWPQPQYSWCQPPAAACVTSPEAALRRLQLG